MAREHWSESDNPSRVAWGMGRIIGVSLLGIALVGVGVWAFKVVTSDVKGAGDVAIKKNSANNRIFAQENFQTLYNQILAYDQQLDQAAKDKAEHPGDAFFATNYSGLVKTCIDARGQYNANASKITQAKWRDTTLPYEIDGTDPKTDCKEKEKS